MNKHSKQKSDERDDKIDAANQAEMADKMEAIPTQAAPGVRAVQPPYPGAKLKWPQQVKSAKRQWGKLSEEEIRKSEGNPQRLSTLVQQRYRIDHQLADKQVKTFLDKCITA
ncbi:CsbD family protein [Bowmanella dokdonensis]|uniref:Uncharacterized protein n=1 Tax=Bowmanella dokdonensis TaxID=751969 RepID=A0A939DP63_9ALTE|nr:hypothetical protein [Bowmanella dokdonensis]MBN7826399.1 hypothetical protein [Bowmanella dokdonensis]